MVSTWRMRAAALVAVALTATSCASDGTASDVRASKSDTASTTETPDPTTDATAVTGPVGEYEAGWLVLVYEAADNDLEGAVLDDVVEMGEVNVDDLDIVVMLDRSDDSDRASGYSSADTYTGIPEDLGASQVLLAGAGGVELRGTVAEVNTGDPQALSDFVSQAIAEFPREHIAVIIGDHGAAWHGVGVDEPDGDILRPQELATAFGTALAAAGRDRFDVIGFDACLMASLEIAAALAPYGHFLVASEEVEPGSGWDWTVLNSMTADVDAVGLATILAEGYSNSYADESEISTQTMSVIDLAKVDELSAALASMIAVAGDDATGSAVSIARSAVRAYGFADSPDPELAFHQLDIGDLVETLAAENPAVAGSAAAVLAALHDAVVYNSHGTFSEQATGMSIYLPPNADLADGSYLELEGMDDWQGLLGSYLEVTASVEVPAAFSDVDKYIEGTWTSGGFQLSSDYDPAADATVVDARLRYGTYTEDFTSMVFYGSDPLRFGDGHVSGVWEPQVMQITDGSTTAFAYSTFEISGDRSRAIVSIPLEYVSPDGDTERVELRFVFDQAGALLSKDFVVFSAFGVGRAPVDPAGEMYPMAAVQSLDTFEEVWQRTSSLPLSADLATFDGTYAPMPETTAIVAQLELHSLDGSVDFLYAGDAVPFAFFSDRATYPAPA